MALDREKSLQTAQKYIDKKRYDRAIEEYQRIVQADPNDARTLLKIGDLQARTQAYSDAIATYDRVGQFYSSQGFALKAIAVYKQIRELIRNHVPQLADRYAHIVPRLAEIYSQLGLTTDALAAYDEVATRFQKTGRDGEAIQVFERMVELDQNNPLPHLRLAEARCRVQAVDEAIGSFWAAAELLLELRRRDDALKVIERILHFRQETRYSLIAAELYIQRGGQQDGLQALAKLQTAFQKEPRNLDILSLLAQAFTLIGQQAKAVEVYKEMARIAREQGNGELFQQLIGHLMSVAPHDEAVTALARLAPTSVPPASAAPISIAPESLSDAELESAPPSARPQQQARSAAHEPVRGPRHSAPDVVVVDDALEVAEEYGDPGSFDSSHHSRKALVDAESFRKLRLYSKALESLRIALEIDPRGIALREKLRDVLWEAGDPDASIGEMITLAAIHLDEGRPEHAEAQLYAVLEAEPQHPVAHQMLTQLSGEAYVEDELEDESGYESYDAEGYTEPDAPQYDSYPDEAQGDYGPQSVRAPASAQHGGYPAPQVRYAPETYDADEPLPSYDLEEVGASEALASDRPRPDPFEADDPFGDAPLPSFPLSADDDELTAGLTDQDLGGGVGGGYGLPSFADLDAELEEAGTGHGALLDDAGLDDGFEAGAELADPPPRMSSPGLDPAQTEQVEEALDEAEFFASRGLWDDAKLIIEDQLRRVPGHPLLVERLEEIEQSIDAHTPSESGARVAQGSGVEQAEYLAPGGELGPADDAFDIAASLGALDELEAPAARSRSLDDVDVDQVFAKFKEGVRAQVSDQDSATHYDLGVAYKEMGLLNDAVGEFELAARDPARECMCYAMIGMVYLESGDLERSAEAYVRGLAAPQKTAEQEMSLYYDLGIVYEMKQSVAEALYYFEKITRRDPGYRDIQERIAALKPATAHASATRAVGDDDEFDAVFDDLFESK